MDRLVYLRNVVTLRLDRDRCAGCGTCVEVCPQAVLALEERKATVVARDACMECGACATNCAVGAITVRAGVGCAQAVINGALGRTGGECCCVAD
jgi:NAD-dependent dihydropyrimidine dehydrogenase PreA subunit